MVDYMNIEYPTSKSIEGYYDLETCAAYSLPKTSAGVFQWIRCQTCYSNFCILWNDGRIFDTLTPTGSSVPAACRPDVDDGKARTGQTHRIPCRRPSDLWADSPADHSARGRGRAALGTTHPKPGSPGLGHLSGNKRRA